VIEIFNCQQGTPEWFQCRLGIPTASEFHSVLAKGEGKTRRTYMYKLIGEQLTGEVQDSFTTVHTERGKIMEAEARALVLFDYPDVREIGFIRRPISPLGSFVGCSPDALVGEDGLLEIKTKLPHLQIAVIREDRLPPEHVAQCQGALWVTGRKWIDFISYWPGLPLFGKRVYPDPEYFAVLEVGLTAFHVEMADVRATLAGMMPTIRVPKKTAQILAGTEFTNLDILTT
jgi:YqaJ-like viral recombinase domain